MSGRIRAGMGGWTFPPWRGVFYPDKLRQADELAWASRKVSSIEINGTYHSLQKRESFARWARETPDDFVFTVKGSRFCTNRGVLASAGEGIARFSTQGMEVMGEKLGPVLWQFMQTKRFDPDDFAAFLRLLPEKAGDRRLRHCVEARHASFADPAFAHLCRQHGVAICLSDSKGWPLIDEPTADFVYARLMRGQDDIETCYPQAQLDAWARRFAGYAPREVFAFFISGGKVRAPAGAQALLERLDTAAAAQP
jgi:uncharacterized protein YecE (DUF72 family)